MLNKLQQQAYDAVVNSDAKKIVLLGPAGTGKSYVTAEIIKDYPGSVAVTATTNKAKDLLSCLSESPANTTQSQMGYKMCRSGKEEYLAKVTDADFASLVIVEEVSMLPKNVYETLEKHLADGDINQILFLGDPVQLPAVGIGINPLDIPKAKIIELTEQMRQAADENLNAYMKAFRTAIETKDNTFDLAENLPTQITVVTSHKTFSELYKQADGVKKILAYSNRVVDSYNMHLNGGSYKVGDEVIIDKPWNNLKNASTVMILKIKEHKDYYDLIVTGGGQTGPMTVYKTKAAYQKQIDEIGDNTIAYWAFVDSCFNLKHQYASTVHKSQGSTYDHVFIDATDVWAAHTRVASKYNNFIQPISFNMFLRLMYVAISRMKYSATIYVGDVRNYKLFEGD